MFGAILKAIPQEINYQKVSCQMGVARSYTREYQAWQDMKQRCDNPNHKAYPNYGGRGIKVHHTFYDFEVFLAEVGPHPGDGYSLDRVDNNRGYIPLNIHWASKREQVNNRRPSSQWRKRKPKNNGTKQDEPEYIEGSLSWL